MTLDLNDPRLTAYALGELDEYELATVERELLHSESSRQAVEEIRQMAGVLREELKSEPQPLLRESQKSTIERQLRPTVDSRPRIASRGLYVTGALLAAASLCVAIYLGWSNRRTGMYQGASSTNSIRLVVSSTNRTVATQSQPSLSQSEELSNRKSAAETKIQKNQIRAESGVQNQPTSAAQLQTVQLPSPPQSLQPSQVVSVETTLADRMFTPPTPKAPAANVRPGTGGGIGMGHFRAQKFMALNTSSSSENYDAEELKNLRNKGRLTLAEALKKYREDFNTEAYDRVVDNPFLRPTQNPLSTFSIDVDTAAYANLRRFLSSGSLPPKDSVRIEEMVNYFSYDYASSKSGDPFSAQVEIGPAAWKPEHRLVRIGLKGREIAQDKRPSSNLVFLIDVSGSMQPPNKLPLIKRALPLLVEKLSENDRVAVVVYAGASGLVLPSTTCNQKAKILAALENLEAGGSTNGASGIQLAYDTAIANFIKGGTNRVILATDGDFNVGVTNQGDLIRLIEEKARSGVFLSVLGFGMGNYKDSTLEKLADKGNGNYAYVDSLQEARKVLVEQMGGTLITIAKDVKIQVEFNPALVGAYRLIGYENRILRAEDFNDDTKDAGEIGAGHTVTALYEVVPPGKEGALPGVDALKYQKPVETTRQSKSGELLNLKLRYKEPDADTSKLLQFPVTDRGTTLAEASRDFKFASAVAALGMILRDSPYKGNATLGSVLELAEAGKGDDKQGYRAEFIELTRQVRELLEVKKTTN